MPLSLTFANPEQEQGFLRSRRLLLVRRMRLLLGAYLLGSCVVYFLFFVHDEEPPSEVAGESYLVQVVSESAVFLGDLLIFLSLLTQDGKLWGHAWLEAAFTAHMIASMAVITFCYPTRYVKLMGYELADVFESGYGSDSSLLLMLDGFVTAVHLGLPIRWHVLLPLELAAMLLYGLNAAVIGSEEPGEAVMANATVLAFLVAFTAWNKREAEKDERSAFESVIGEKALRCQAEHQLSQVREEHRPKGPASEDNSVPTDRSGAIFDARLFEGNMTQQLELVAAKGESEHWRIPAGELRFLGEGVLGEGGFGSVKRAEFCGMMVAVKCPRLVTGVNTLGELCNELRILRHLRHPHIVTAHGAVVLPQEQEIHLVLELVEGLSLTSFLQSEEGPSTLQRYQIMLGVCRALVYMHSRVPHVVHGDLKGDNIMVELCGGQAVPKVLDFGLSRLLNCRARPLGGTLAWMAPELTCRPAPPVRCSADVYSFGHLVSYCATGIPPMCNMSRGMMRRALGSKRPAVPVWPEGCPFRPGCAPLVQACLDLKPERRPGMPGVHRGLLGLSARLQLPEGRFLRQLRDLASFEGGEAPALPEKLASLPEESDGPALGSADLQATVEGASRQREILELPQTSKEAMEASLVAAFKRWNIPRSCCKRHACAARCLGIAGDLLVGECGTDRQDCEAALQCVNCFVLGVKGRQCDLCGMEQLTESDLLTARLTATL